MHHRGRTGMLGHGTGAAGLIGAAIAVLLLAAAVLARPVAAADHGHAAVGSLARSADFGAFPDVSPDAPRGGTLRLGRVEAFETLETLRYAGRSPSDLRLTRDTLLVAAPDEPASHYGLLAESVRVSDDLSGVVFTLRPEARWHDGLPVTAADVVHTIRTFAADGAPFYRQALRGVTVEALGPREVAVENGGTPRRDFVGLVGRLPIHPAPADAQRPDGIAPSPGSGPYRVVRAEPGRFLRLERVGDYWADDLPVTRGRWRFDRIEISFFRDTTVAREAFLGGTFDAWVEADPRAWRTVEAAVADDPALRSVEFDRPGPGTVRMLAFNLRRPPFDDRRVRRAFALAFDFDTVDATLFGGDLAPAGSVFAETAYCACGPADGAEESLLAPYLEGLPDGILRRQGPGEAAGTTGRARLARAAALLDEAGLPLVDGVRRSRDGRTPLVVEVVSRDPGLERVLGVYARALERLGIALVLGGSEPGVAGQRMLDRDFDLADVGWTPSMMPGETESLLWSGALADMPRSYALAGARDPALDAALAAMIEARSVEALAPAARAFDRVLRWQTYAVPLWRDDRLRVAYREGLAHPRGPYAGADVAETWWRADAREAARRGATNP